MRLPTVVPGSPTPVTLFFATAPGAADRFAATLAARLA